MAVEHLNPAEDHRRTNQEDDRHNNDEDGERVRQVFTGRSSREGPKAPRRRTRQAGPNSVIGGLGEGVAGVLARNYPVPVDMVGIDDEFGQSGHGELIAHYGLAETDLAAAVKGVIARKRA